MALEPCYGHNGGNAVRVYTRDGSSFLDERRMKTVIKNICAFFNADLTALSDNYGHYLGCKQDVPLPLSPVLVLVRVKMRRPRYENDGATGYFSLRDVTGISAPGPDREQGTCCLVNLNGGHSVPSFFSKNNVQKRLSRANVALDRFNSLQKRDQDLEQLKELLENEMLADKRIKLLWELLKHR